MGTKRIVNGGFTNFSQSHSKFKKSQKIDSHSSKYQDISKVTCPYCGGKMILRDATFLDHNKGTYPLMVCENYPSCDSYCTVRKVEKNKVALKSSPANKKLRALRREAHHYMKKLLENGIFETVNDVYWYLTNKSGNSSNMVHIGMMQEYGCKEVIHYCIEALYNNKSRIKRFRMWENGYSQNTPELKKMLDEMCFPFLV